MRSRLSQGFQGDMKILNFGITGCGESLKKSRRDRKCSRRVGWQG